MRKYKVCVYAICKNEEKFVSRWYESMKEADEIYVLDTGSTDKTVEKLQELGVFVTKMEINPWRFDVARNKSLDLVPKDCDICVCTDLDEVFMTGWRDKLEEYWQDNTTRARFTYNWSLDDNGKPLVSFYYEKTHAREGYRWTHPVHEVLTNCRNDEKFITCNDIVLNHYPDSTKSRGSYLPLLELSVEEDPLDDRNMHYLGREYMYYGRWNECIDTLIKHLNLERATWNDERCASCRFIARSYSNMDRMEEAIMWGKKAIEEAPYLRDPYVELGIIYFKKGDYLNVIKYLTEALKIKYHPKTYINEVFSFDYTIDNLLSVSYYHLELYDISLFFIDRALKYDDKNEMLIKNKEIIMEKASFSNFRIS